MKRIIAITVTAVMLFVCMPLMAAGEEYSEGVEIAVDVQAWAEAMLQGSPTAPIQRVIDVKRTYGPSDFISADLIPYLICEKHGMNCEVKNKCTWENLEISFTENGDYVDVKFNLKDYGSWKCIQATVKPTKAAKDAPIPARVRGTFYFTITENGETHKTYGPELILYLKGQSGKGTSSKAESSAAPSSSTSSSEAPSESSAPTTVSEAALSSPSSAAPVTPDIKDLKEGYDLFENVKAYADKLKAGNSPKPIRRVLYIGKEYGLQPLMEESLIAYLPCRIDGNGCGVTSQCKKEDIKVALTENGDLVDISFDYDDSGRILVKVQPTDAGKKAALPQTVKGRFYFEKQGAGLVHQTEGIFFEFTLAGSGMPGWLKVVIVVAVVVLVAAGVTLSIILRKKKA